MSKSGIEITTREELIKAIKEGSYYPPKARLVTIPEPRIFFDEQLINIYNNTRKDACLDLATTLKKLYKEQDFKAEKDGDNFAVKIKNKKTNEFQVLFGFGKDKSGRPVIYCETYSKQEDILKVIEKLNSGIKDKKQRIICMPWGNKLPRPIDMAFSDDFHQEFVSMTKQLVTSHKAAQIIIADNIGDIPTNGGTIARLLQHNNSVFIGEDHQDPLMRTELADNMAQLKPETLYVELPRLFAAYFQRFNIDPSISAKDLLTKIDAPDQDGSFAALLEQARKNGIQVIPYDYYDRNAFMGVVPSPECVLQRFQEADGVLATNLTMLQMENPGTSIIIGGALHSAAADIIGIPSINILPEKSHVAGAVSYEKGVRMQQGEISYPEIPGMAMPFKANVIRTSGKVIEPQPPAFEIKDAVKALASLIFLSVVASAVIGRNN